MIKIRIQTERRASNITSWRVAPSNFGAMLKERSPIVEAHGARANLREEEII